MSLFRQDLDPCWGLPSPPPPPTRLRGIAVTAFLAVGIGARSLRMQVVGVNVLIFNQCGIPQIVQPEHTVKRYWKEREHKCEHVSQTFPSSSVWFLWYM